MGWNDVNPPKQDKQQAEKTKYNKLITGKTHTGRILDAEPKSRYTHWIQAANGGKGVTVDCPGAGCPICADIKAKKKTGEKQKYNSRKMHAINWLNRETGEIEVIDKGKALFEPLQGLLAEVGDLRNYDVKIRVTGQDTETAYTPIPLAPKPLTDEEKALQKYDLEKITLQVNNEQIQMLMNGASLADIFGEANVEKENNADASEEAPNVDFTQN